MICQQCQENQANVHFTSIVNNKRIEMYLCEKCAADKGKLGIGITPGLSDFLFDFMGMHGGALQYGRDEPSFQCEVCGMNFEDFKKNGKMGCSNCYTYYGERLKPIIKRLHGSAKHIGRAPSAVSNEMERSREIGRLKEQLQKAVNAEEYEKAAELRDRIRQIELKMG